MTTIATDGMTLAGDGRLTANDTILSETCPKVHRMKDGRLFGASGTAQDGARVMRWLEEGGEMPMVDDDFGALVVSPGKIEWYGNGLEPDVVMAPAAVGSGMDFALGAMEAGASPAHAVEIACRRDMHSGGEITALSLDD